MKFSCIVVAISLLGNGLVLGQTQFVVTGIVKDSLTRTPIPRTTILIKGGFLTTRCDDSGRFALTLPVGKHTLRFQHIAYKVAETTIEVDTATQLRLSIYLQERDLSSVGTITVEAERAREKQSSLYEVTSRGVKNVPPLGEPDMMRAISLLPGIAQINDLKATLNVRGGSSDQNQILLDGVEVYNPNHLLGLFSAFNLSAIERADVYTANFPAEYGNRLSSVISITTKSSADTAITTGNIGLLSSSLTVARQWDKSFLLLAGRLTYLDWITRLFGRRFPYGFYDANLKFNQGFGEHIQAEVIGFTNSDTFLPNALEPPEVQDPENQGRTTTHTWGNRLVALRLKFITEKSKHSLTGSFVQNAVNFDYLSGAGFIRNTLNDLTLRTDSEVRWYNQQLKFGTEFKQLQTTYGWNGSDTRFPIEIYLYPGIAPIYQGEQNLRLFSLYFSDEWTLSQAITMQAALRYTSGKALNAGEFSPRASMSWQVAASTKLYASVGRYVQFIAEGREGQEGSISSPLFALDRPNAAWITVAGFFLEINDYRITAEVYHKIYSDIVELNTSSAEVLRLYPSFRYGSGRSSGIDLFIEKNIGVVTFQTAYSFLSSEVLDLLRS